MLKQILLTKLVMHFFKLLFILSVFKTFGKTRSSSELIQEHPPNTRLRRSRAADTADQAERKTAVQSLPLQNLMAKIQQKRPLHLLVIGGSNTAGGGMQIESEIYYDIFTKWWNEEISKTTGSTLKAHKIAIGGTGSDFFSFCFQNYLPKEKPDMVLVELSVNDYGYKYGEAAKPMEMLTRRLLLLSSKPLVMYIHLVDRGMNKNDVTNTGCGNMEDLGFTKLGEHYGIPSFSWRDFLCPLTSSGSREKMSTEVNMFNTDMSHIGSKAHAQVASKIIDYFKESLALYSSGQTSNIVDSQVNTNSLIEPVFLKPSVSDSDVAFSQCLSFLASDWQTPLRQSLTFKVTVSKDFRFLSPTASKKTMKHKPFRTDAYGCWESKSKSGLLKIHFLVSNKGPPTRSVAVIFRTKDNQASTKIWLDDDQKSAITVDSNKCGHHMYQTRLEPLATGISPGYHTLNVISNGGGWFEVSGIVVGYPSYQGYKGYRPFDVKAKMWNLENFKKLRC